MLNSIPVFIAFVLGGIFVAGAVALGGLLVFRTKREPHEGLFQMGPAKGGAFVVDPYDDHPAKPTEGRSFNLGAGEGWGAPGPARRDDDEAAALMDAQIAKFHEQLKMAKTVAEQPKGEAKPAAGEVKSGL